MPAGRLLSARAQCTELSSSPSFCKHGAALNTCGFASGPASSPALWRAFQGDFQAVIRMPTSEAKKCAIKAERNDAKIRACAFSVPAQARALQHLPKADRRAVR
eukprot:6187563-Pleurochrysis_carterae.AAC.1